MTKSFAERKRRKESEKNVTRAYARREKEIVTEKNNIMLFIMSVELRIQH
jgi:hypothetical protein